MEKIPDNLFKKYNFFQILSPISISNINKTVIFSKTYVYIKYLILERILDIWTCHTFSELDVLEEFFSFQLINCLWNEKYSHTIFTL